MPGSAGGEGKQGNREREMDGEMEICLKGEAEAALRDRSADLLRVMRCVHVSERIQNWALSIIHSTEPVITYRVPV